LQRDGYEQLGKVRFGERMHVIWSKAPEGFRVVGANSLWAVDPQRVRTHLAAREERIGTKDEL
jgi:hypothetical protein